MTEELAKGIDAAARLAADTAVGTLRQQLLSASLEARGGSAAGSASGSSLLVHALAEALAALPQLSDARDQEQVEGITRLAQVLQVGAGWQLAGGWVGGQLDAGALGGVRAWCVGPLPSLHEHCRHQLLPSGPLQPSTGVDSGPAAAGWRLVQRGSGCHWSGGWHAL